MSTPQPYASGLPIYVQAGWRGVLPLPPGLKTPPPVGFTGSGDDPTNEQLLTWATSHAAGNLALRMPANVVGIDVDAYDGKAGAESLRAAVDTWGELPPTWMSSSRVDGISGIRFYRVPEGLAWPNTIGPGIETIRRGHRYAVAWPSIHPTGAQYMWLFTDGSSAGVPKVDDLPWLPAEWVEGLTQGVADKGPSLRVVVDADEGYGALADYLSPGDCGRVAELLDDVLDALEGPSGSRHDQVRDAMLQLLSLGQRGHGGVAYAMSQTEARFMAVVGAERGGNAADSEWRRMLEGAVEIVLADLRPKEPCAGKVCDLKAPSLVDLGLMLAASPIEVPGQPLPASDALSGPRTRYADMEWTRSGVAPAPEPPTVMQRDDEVGLFYEGRVNGIFGDPETAKSWIAMAAIVQQLRRESGPYRCAYIDVDHNGSVDIGTRMLNLGAPAELLADPDWFRLYEPEDGGELLAAVSELIVWEPSIAVLDSLGEVIPMLGLSSKDNDDITRGLRAVTVPLANAGACVITIDHLPKGTDARSSGFAIGGTAKKRAINGSYLKARVGSQSPAPGVRASVYLDIEKDRPGQLRRVSTRNSAGEFVLDGARTDGMTGFEVLAQAKPQPGGAASLSVEDANAIIGVLMARGPMSAAGINAEIKLLRAKGFGNGVIGRLLEQLRVRGCVAQCFELPKVGGSVPWKALKVYDPNEVLLEPGSSFGLHESGQT